MRRRTHFALATALLALLLGGCNKGDSAAAGTGGEAGTTGAVATTATTGTAGTTGGSTGDAEAPVAAKSAPLDIVAYNAALTQAVEGLTPANLALQEKTQSFKSEAAKDLNAAKKSFGEGYRSFGQAYQKAAENLTTINPPPGLEKYHEVLTDGTRRLGEASLEAAEGLINGDDAKFKSAGEKIDGLQKSFQSDLGAALSGSPYKADAQGNLVKK